MNTSPMLFFHILSGTVGLLAGGVAMSFRKGSHFHRLAGNVFVISMLCLGASGAYMAMLISQPNNVIGGALTCYLVATAWMAARRKDGETGIFDWGALLFALAAVAGMWTMGLQAAMSVTGRKFGYPPGIYFFVGLMTLAFAAGDIRMLVRGGLSGTQRLRRRLWRMCYAWFIASVSLFGRPHLFPVFLRKSGALVFLSFLPLLFMIFWLIRVGSPKGYPKKLLFNNRYTSAIGRPTTLQ
jgi:hypothetical protein